MLGLSLLLLIASTVSARPPLPWAELLHTPSLENPLLEIAIPSETLAPPFPWAELFAEHQESSPVKTAATSSSSQAMTLLYKFTDRTQLENIVVRPNGGLLLTVSNKPQVWYMDPTKHNQPPRLLYQFDGATSTLGIAETTPDVFVVAVGNYTGFEGVPGTFSIYSIDFTQSKPSVAKVAALPGAAALNGITAIDGSRTTIVAADSTLGAIWKLDTSSADNDISMLHVLLTNCTGSSPLAVNGLWSRDSKLYFTNSALNIFGRVELNEDCSANGEVEVIAHAMEGAQAYDDFCMDWAGNAWVGTHPGFLTQIAPEGKQRNFTGGDDVQINHPTGVAAGRGSKQEEDRLYIVTSAGQIIGVELSLL